MDQPAAAETSHAAQDERRLLEQARTGDFAAFQTLVERFQKRVYGLAFRITGQREDAEDVTQQTFLSLVEHLDSFRGESAVSTWVLRIATNHALQILRKRRGRKTYSLDESPGDDSYASMPHPEYIAQWRETPDQLAQQAEVRQQIDAALQTLGDKYRTVFVLRDIEGLSTRETAEALELTEAAVKVRLLRARLQLREQLTRSFGDEATRMFPSHDHDEG